MVENSDFSPPADPWDLFREWYAMAGESEPNDPNAMTLATVGADGMPSARIVLLKGFDVHGLVFFTNRLSVKGGQLTQNPKAAVCFHWKSIKRQIRAEGNVSLVDDADSNAYFASRPRTAQIGAWASLQSKALASREMLEERVAEFEKKFAAKLVPRPPHWGGYHLAPRRIEFWQERPFRLHDRIVYTRASEQESWTQERLYP